MNESMKRLTLRLEVHPTATPSPMCFHVFDGETDLGIVTLPEFNRAKAKLAECGPPLPRYLDEEPAG